MTNENTGWFGPAACLHCVLAAVGADTDDDGRYLIYREGPFAGLDGDVVISGISEYSVGGRRANLAGLLNSTSYGVRNITVL